jgi:uncharacterized protein YndB with AHSA1/START domain
MIQIKLARQIAAPPEAVFEVLADHRGMVNWSMAREVVLRHEGDPPPNGVGAVRVIRAGGIAVEEEVTAFEPPKRMEYRVVAGFPIRDHRGEVRLEPVGDGTRLVWEVQCRPRFPGTGWLLRPLLTRSVTQLADGLVRQVMAGRG